MARSQSQSLPALLVRSRLSLGMSQKQLGELLGVSRSTINRWAGGRHSGVIGSQLATLAGALLPRDAALAAEVAAYGHETLETLGLVAAPAPPPAPPAPEPIPLAHLADSALCAAAEAGSLSPAQVRPMLVAALERAKGVRLSVEELLQGLREVKGTKRGS
ncbi:MAG TPA: helix-turn-helix transcriptional regulator [Polyangiaceae bacterium]